MDLWHIKDAPERLHLFQPDLDVFQLAFLPIFLLHLLLMHLHVAVHNLVRGGNFGEHGVLLPLPEHGGTTALFS